jgi:hypothetical protein
MRSLWVIMNNLKINAISAHFFIVLVKNHRGFHKEALVLLAKIELSHQPNFYMEKNQP